jgi:rhodanese-related sulfurtransferase
MKRIQDIIADIKTALPNITPKPTGLKAQSDVHDLKSRLEWGEPGLTIMDVRDREAFNDGHITGAIPMPLLSLMETVRDAKLPMERDIYVYGNTDEETAEAAAQLREAGFQYVSELKGGLNAWKSVAGPTDGSQEEGGHLSPASYNVIAQLARHQKTQKMFSR